MLRAGSYLPDGCCGMAVQRHLLKAVCRMFMNKQLIPSRTDSLSKSESLAGCHVIWSSPKGRGSKTVSRRIASCICTRWSSFRECNSIRVGLFIPAQIHVGHSRRVRAFRDDHDENQMCRWTRFQLSAGGLYILAELCTAVCLAS